MKETILFLCAHNDDQIIGGGGTFAKYSQEGKKVKTVIFSYGEMSHPHLKRKIVVDMRRKEAEKSDKILGGKGLFFLGLNEGKFKQEITHKGVKEQLADYIKKEHPSKIFTHSHDDPHPDHNAVYNLATQLIKDKIITCPVYTFEVWNPFNVRNRDVPKLVVDISETYKSKVKAYDAHESQVNLPLMLPMKFRMWLSAVLAGWSNNTKYAEVFHKLA